MLWRLAPAAIETAKASIASPTAIPIVISQFTSKRPVRSKVAAGL
jgi:hypothetical protein